MKRKFIKKLKSFSRGFKRLRKRTKVLIILFFIFLLFLFVAPFFGLKVMCPFISDVSKSELVINEKIDRGDINIEGYNRPEESTYLTFTEWHLVYISEEYANWVKDERPSEFPYFSSIGQFWKGYCNVYEITKKQYRFNLGNHFMLWVIGTSSSIEFGVKGIYENSIGRFTEWTSSYTRTEEDEFAYRFNKEYVDFLYDVPWYEFSFAGKFGELWKETDIIGPNILRKLERRGILSLELGIKTIYGVIIKLGTRLLYETAPLEIYASVENTSEDLFIKYPELKKVIELEDSSKHIIKIPRYRMFTEIVPKLSRDGVNFIDIAGNDEIFFTIIAPVDRYYTLDKSESLFEMELLTNQNLKRIGVRAEVSSLHKILIELENQDIKIEHIYDY